MSKSKDIYIGSISPTIGVVEQRELLKMAKTVNPMLTKTEFVKIMVVYKEALERIFEENGIKEDTK